MITLHDMLVGLGVSMLETAAIVVAMWLGISLLSYSDENRKQS